jgi:hypothetical protein
MHAYIHRLALCAALVVVAACDAPAAEEFGDTGSLALPLVQPGADGSFYELANATFVITAADGEHTLDGSGNETQLHIDLPAGLATVQLLDGWQLRRTLAGQTISEEVPAVLGTINPVSLRVLANQSAQVSFGFIVRTQGGDLSVTFGVSEEPRELAGGLRVETATGGFTGYTDGSFTPRMDFAVFFELARLDATILPDGSKDHAYFAGPVDEFTTTPVAAEFYNDAAGVLATVIGPSFAGANLEYHLTAKPDGTRELRGSIYGNAPPYASLDFGPYTLTADLPLDAAGFPADVFFHDAFVPFKLLAYLPDGGESTMTGLLNLRHIVP